MISMATMATMAKLWFFYKIYHYYKNYDYYGKTIISLWNLWPLWPLWNFPGFADAAERCCLLVQGTVLNLTSIDNVHTIIISLSEMVPPMNSNESRRSGGAYTNLHQQNQGVLSSTGQCYSAHREGPPVECFHSTIHSLSQCS